MFSKPASRMSQSNPSEDQPLMPKGVKWEQAMKTLKLRKLNTIKWKLDE